MEKPAPAPSGQADFTDGYSDRLEKCYSGAVYDVLRAMGHPNQVLPSTLRPLLPDRSLAGRIYTIGGHAKPNLDGHQTLLSWTEMLSRAPRGSVVMMQHVVLMPLINFMNIPALIREFILFLVFPMKPMMKLFKPHK